MKILYLDCSMGASGDMLMAALFELLDNDKKEAFLHRTNNMGLAGLSVEALPSQKCGIIGTHMSVSINGQEEEVHDHAHSHNHTHSHEHHHSHFGMTEVRSVISSLDIPDTVKDNALQVYETIALAESGVHGTPIDHIHFHEVGTMDAVADVVGVSLLMHMLAPDKVAASPVHVGCGQVHCAHGILPVPAPATALILQGIPIYGGNISGELCTPTGAALLKHFVSEFGNMPMFKCEKTGYGMGSKDFEAANCLRAMLGSALESVSDNAADEIIELACNLDDMTPEAAGFAQEQLFATGALDVFITPIIMKKNRPAFMLTCICRSSDIEDITNCIFRHTTTLGIREHICCRHILDRKEFSTDTPLGAVRIKESSGFGIIRRKAEYEDLAKIARDNGISLADAESVLQKALHGK